MKECLNIEELGKAFEMHTPIKFNNKYSIIIELLYVRDMKRISFDEYSVAVNTADGI